MATWLGESLVLLFAIGLVTLLFYLFIGGLTKVYQRIGLTKSEAGTILTLTLFLGWITIPLFPYNRYWIGMSLGGALIPVVLCYYLLRSRRVAVAEGAIGVVIVATITYFVTRAEQGVGIVADWPVAFAPAVAAGFYSVSTFWTDVRKAAPLAYFSGVIGTLVGADVFRLMDYVAVPGPTDKTVILSIGGANIFDLVYLAGIVAVFVDSAIFWVERQEQKRGVGRAVAELSKLPVGAEYPKDEKFEPTLRPSRKGQL